MTTKIKTNTGSMIAVADDDDLFDLIEEQFDGDAIIGFRD